ncbi:hypothetical protein DPMN_041484 [Dreissena polymorpha]|uniref:Uncharacterized protein n=1 Tax=Dreissena polymorpha TaxID=45954 RepID=A0A9D4HW48_DREPO|nr:hypothetical protein DPMN_041484 [Dreissena polymorpha]
MFQDRNWINWLHDALGTLGTVILYTQLPNNMIREGNVMAALTSIEPLLWFSRRKMELEMLKLESFNCAYIMMIDNELDGTTHPNTNFKLGNSQAFKTSGKCSGDDSLFHFGYVTMSFVEDDDMMMSTS